MKREEGIEKGGVSLQEHVLCWLLHWNVMHSEPSG